MRLLLIRHGETVDNVAGIYAGTTDSALTSHGVLQANRLAIHLAATDIKISHIFSSDLQRAAKTADAIRVAQSPASERVMRLPILREQDFGFYEGKQFFERPRGSNKTGKEAHLAAHRNEPGFKDVESKPAMTLRMETFIDTHLLQLIKEVHEEHAVVVVAHGIILTYLWRCIIRRFHPNDVSVAPGIVTGDRGIEYLGGWSNTGYLELEVKQRAMLVSIPLPIPVAEPVQADISAPSLPISRQPLPPSDSSSIPEQPNTPLSASVTSAEVSRPKLLHHSLVVKAVNSQEHLKGLKKTRGGIGSLKHDTSQKTVDSFFKKQRTE
ncbi:hypothetical protein G7Y89_g585 [Cudoniella acicularis]|uniref:Phosphoglycerate mutase n=1 Tax=Cudoniella acicularis TaxID=354080 RepID=A0A8H4WB23_9HELO|nr:hypothetical protein G7Y89_g585 [Cudoniella acicularis]